MASVLVSVPGRSYPSFVQRCVPMLSRARHVSTCKRRIPSTRNEGYSSHPDALRRRREAEARQKRRMRELEQLAAEISGRSTDEPPNITHIHTASELEWRRGSNSNKTTLVHFKSPSCQSCIRLFPKLKRAAQMNPDVKFLVVDVTSPDVQRLCGEMGITRLPFFQLYEKGVIISQGSWGSIGLLKVAANHADDGPLCTLSAPPSETHTPGRWEKVQQAKSDNSSNGESEKPSDEKKGLDVLFNSSALEWVPDSTQE